MHFFSISVGEKHRFHIFGNSHVVTCPFGSTFSPVKTTNDLTTATEMAGPSSTRDAGEHMFMLDFDGRKHQTWQVWWNNNSALRFTLLYDPDKMTKWQMGQLFMKFRRAELRDQELPKDHEPMALWCAGDRTRTGACWGMELGCEWNCGVFVQTKISVFFNDYHRVPSGKLT